MPTTTRNVPGYGEVEFPDTMSPAEVETAVSKLSSPLAEKGATEAPSGFLPALLGLPARAQAIVSGTPEAAGPLLSKAGWTPEQIAAKQADLAGSLRGAPGSWAELIAKVAIPALTARLMPAERGLAPFLKTLGTNVGLGGAAGAGIGAIEGGLTGQNPLEAGFEKGAVATLESLPSGLAQGTLGAALGPRVAFREARKAVLDAKTVLSPRVGAPLDINNPAGLFSRKMVNTMIDEAGKTLDEMEARVVTALNTQKGQLGATFQGIRDKIKGFRDIGERAYMTPDMQQAARKAMAAAEKEEIKLAALLTGANRPDLLTDYTTTLSRYASDRSFLRVLKAIQRATALPGGMNRADNLTAAGVVDALRVPDMAPTARAAAMAAVTMAGHPFMALHFMPQKGLSGVYGNPAKLVPLSARQRLAGPLSAGGGIGARLLTPSLEGEEE